MTINYFTTRSSKKERKVITSENINTFQQTCDFFKGFFVFFRFLNVVLVRFEGMLETVQKAPSIVVQGDPSQMQLLRDTKGNL